jgi:glycosyltransferase involved in cell wall biosynthesis
MSGSDGPPVISVVTPTHRRVRPLVEAVRSVLTQRGPSVEVIVVDDAPDETDAQGERARAALEALRDPRVRYVARSEPTGRRPALARRDGLALARGRYVWFLDDDDVLVDGALAALAGALDRAPHAGVALGGIEPFRDACDGDEAAVSLAHERAYFAIARRRLLRAARLRTRYALVACLLFQNAPLVCSSGLIRRSLAERIGWDATLPYCEDGEFYLRAIREGGFVYEDRPVVRYRTGAPSLMRDAAKRQDALNAAYRAIHAKYRRAHGALEFWGLRVVARGL